MLRVYIWRIAHPRRYWAARADHAKLTDMVQNKLDWRRWGIEPDDNTVP